MTALLPAEASQALTTELQPLVVIRPEATPDALATALVMVARQRIGLAYDAMDDWWRVSRPEARQALVFRLCSALREVDAMSTQALLDPRWRAGVGVPLALATMAVNLRARRKHRATNTLRAQASDWRVWRRWCKANRKPSFNPSARQLEEFLASYAPRHKLATIQRWGSSLAAMHEAAGFQNPLQAPIVRDVWLTALKAPDPEGGKTDRRNVPVDQAEGLTRDQLDRVLAACDTTSLMGARDAALLAVAYDLMGRRSEVVALNRDDIRIHEEKGIGIAVIRRSKTDKKGEGKELFLRADTCKRLLHWIELAKIDDDDLAIFRSLKGFAAAGRAKPRRRLPAAELSTIIRRRVRAAKLFPESWSDKQVEAAIRRFSGHSLRVGAAQDMVEAGMSDGDIMNTARWKNLGTLLRYTAAQRAERGGMAKMAALQAGLPSPAENAA